MSQHVMRLAAVVALMSVLATVSGVARAEEPRRLVFDARFRPFQWPDAVQTTITLGAYAYLEFEVEYPEQPRWEGPILFDSAFREALVAKSREGRRNAALVSDITWYVPMALPWVEGVALPLFTDNWNFRAAWEMSAMNVQATAVVALLTRAGHKVVARARPDTQPCNEDPNYDDTCFAGSFAGFPSGHVSAGLVGAGLSCAHHVYLPLLGSAPADITVCVAASALGVTNGIARIAADRHYLTDVMAGAVLGWGVGFAMPALLHYRWFSGPAQGAWTVSPWVTGSGLGASALGLW